MSDAQVNHIIKTSGPFAQDGSSVVTPLQNASTDLVTISAYTAGSTANNFLKLGPWNESGSAQYQVPASFYLFAAGLYFMNLTANVQLGIGYGTAGLITEDTATAPTGLVMFGGGSTVTTLRSVASVGPYVFYPFPMRFPANAFPFIKTITGGEAYSVVIPAVLQPV